MAKNIYLLYSSVTEQIYVNDRGVPFRDKNSTTVGAAGDLSGLVNFLSENYKDRKAVAFTNLPEERFIRLERLIGKRHALRRMILERDQEGI